MREQKEIEKELEESIDDLDEISDVGREWFVGYINALEWVLKEDENGKND